MMRLATTLTELGREFGEAFNRLDGTAADSSKPKSERTIRRFECDSRGGRIAMGPKVPVRG